MPEEKPLTGVPHPEIVPPLVSDAICIPEPMEIAMTPPDMSVEDEIIIPQPQITLSSPPSTHSSSRSPDKKSDPRKEKKDRDKERDKDRDREPGRKKSRKDSDKEDGRGKSKESSRSRKGKEQQQQPESVVVSEAEPVKGAPGDDEVVVVGGRTAPPSRNQPNLREAAKAMPRIPKISQRHPPSSTTGPSAPHNRDPRLMMLKSNQGESANLSLSFFCLFIPGAGHSPNVTKDEHNGHVVGGGGKISSAHPSEDDVQVVAAFRNVRNNIGRSRNSHNIKRSPSPGNQG